jgi:serine/threonine-protein kinase SRPK3
MPPEWEAAPDALGSPTQDSPWKYFPFQLGESEDLENYEPGGFHPVHLGDVFDDRYRIVHKLGFGGFSTVWLARDSIENRWVALKIIAARDSATYNDRSTISNHPALAMSDLFATVKQQFWFTGPNGQHLCLVLPVLGPDLSRLSKGIYSRLNSDLVRHVSLQAARALVQLHSHGLCHGG